MNVLMGVGNDLRGDDAVGVYIAKKFMDIAPSGWHVIVAGEVPEDFTSEIKKIQPDLLVIVDAAIMGLEPGDYRIVPENKISNVAFSTHGMPLSFLISYLRDYVGEVILIGIEPESMEFGVEISQRVLHSAERILQILQSGDVRSIPKL